MNPTPYRHAADRIVSRIAVPVLREPVFFCFMLLTFVWPQLTSDLFRIEATHWEILGLYIAYAYAATLPLGILGGKARRWYKTAAYTLAYAVSMAECFLLVFFRTFITPSLMSIATDTDPAESAEFIGCYLFTGRFALFLAAWSLVAGINLLLEKVSQARRTAPMPHAGLRTCLRTTVLAGGGIFGLTSNASAFESAWRLSRIHDRHELHELLREDPELCLERRSAPERLFFSLRMQAFDRNAIGSLHEAMESIAIDSCTFRSPEIVLILGESYNKHHAALYGYPLPTTPRLSQEEAAGRLYPFTDVVSPANFTVKAMHLLFSFASQDRQTAWCDTPLFPALFRRAGYDTLMFDNQTTFTLENDDVWDQEIRHFLYHPRLSPQLFTHCNADKYPFDEGLLADFDRQDLRFRNPHRLTIFHLMGQHVAYRNRFPAEAGYFTADSIPEYSTSGLRRSRDERRIVADYDNAVRYNDRVVGEILDRCRTRDGVVVYPTDSVYAYGCSLRSARGLERLRQLSGKQTGELSIICDGISRAAEYCRVDNAAFKILKRNLPGAITFLLDASSRMPDKALQRRKTIGVRIPDNAIPRAIVEQLGCPLITASLKSDDDAEYMTDPELIHERYGREVALVVDGGYGSIVPTTVVDLTQEEPEIVRQGAAELN